MEVPVPTPMSTPPLGLRRVLQFAVAGAVLVAVFVLAFTWPSTSSTPKNLPVGISGAPEQVAAVTAALTENTGDLLDLVTASDRDAAVADIESRVTYGAIVLQEQGAPEVLTAPASNPAATSMLTTVAAQLQAQATQQAAAAGLDPASAQVAVTPVVSLSADDPTGSGLAGAAFPMMFGGMIGGALLSMLIKNTRERFIGATLLAALAGLAASLILGTWFGFLPGGFWINALVIGVSILATSSFIIGCVELVGTAGIGIGAITTMLIANPISSAAAPWQFLPAPWGTIGQLFVPGASNWLLRSVNYFPAASDVKQWLVLSGWIVGGIVLTLIGMAVRGRKAATVPAEVAPVAA